MTCIVESLPLVALLLTILNFGYTLLKDRRLDEKSKLEEAQRIENEKRLEERMKQMEEAQEKEKRAELIRRSKASGPYFALSSDLFSYITDQTPDGQAFMYRAGGGNILYLQRHEVAESLDTTDTVYLIVENRAKSARKIRLSGDINGISLGREPEMSGSHQNLFFKYPFAPGDRGKVQKIIISFESEDGYDLTHVYQTRHGFFELMRIDPP